ncbi:hypothetical protein C922_04961 [Plasmodium inui San Antonio 1]|uniref:Uncharacterized protein n=1 Tax=Plasmodium inui San Antonio 1 TaxID=1237626 RepID=W6ZZJ6_9APIC|nr:hypothetical protein C922_04961 [Plasmodium inui San Antonio 1]EUD64705.1 hypothetical protein C922_04961 [Plasmodium inui San Antonio 1]
MITNGWYSHGQHAYRSQYFNSGKVMNINQFEGKEMRTLQHVNKDNEKKGFVLCGLPGDQWKTNLHLKYGQLHKGTNQFSNQNNNQQGEEDDEEEDSDIDIDSEFDLEDDYYEDDYDDEEDNDPEAYRERNRMMRKRVKK